MDKLHDAVREARAVNKLEKSLRDDGSCSLGFRMKALPVATAYGRNQRGIIPGN